MAGIGFELQKVLKGGGLKNLFKVALAGIVIVAGPWLISIVGIFFLNKFASFALAEGGDLFMAAIVYTYAFSLSLFGGLHYIFTRYISDLIYIGREDRAVSTLLLSLLLTAGLAALVSIPAALSVSSEGVSRLTLYRISVIALFITVNQIWLVMIFITLLKKYMTIFLVYLTGMAVSFFSVYFLGGSLGLGGALAGFTLGQICIFVLLLILIVRAFPPKKNFSEFRPLISYFGKFKFLFLSGVFYSLAIWIDKLVLWYIKGSPVRGAFFRLFEQYDITVYFANLTIIPGLVYFMIFSETDFYNALRKFLLSIEKGILTKIKEEKFRLKRMVNRSLYEQNFFQGVLTAGLIILAPQIRSGFLNELTDVNTIRVVLAAGFFHILYLTLLTFLFYIEMYREAFATTLLFFFVNMSLTASLALMDFPFYGPGYLMSAIVASLSAFLFLKLGINSLDRKVYGKL